MKLRKDYLIPIDDTNWPKENPKYYTYAYMCGNIIKYTGRGSDGNQNKKKRFGRARNILNGGHNEHCVANVDNITSIKIIGGFDESDKCTMNEAAHIKFFNLLDPKVGWNLREELIDPKFYAMLEILDGNERDADIPTMMHYMMQGALGSSSVENEKLARNILSNINFDHRKVVVVGNYGFGSYNFLKGLIDLQDKTPREISLIISQKFLIKIGVDGMIDKKALKIQTGIENFLDPTFRETGDVWVFNPPFEEKGIQFIEKVANLMTPGDKMVCIMATDMFSPMPLVEVKQPGTFYWLNQRGNFERIEMYRDTKTSNMPADRVTFNGITPTSWFVWEKKIPDRLGETTITNVLGETFQYQLTGEEFKIPREPWEKIKFVINWDVRKALHSAQVDAKSSKRKDPNVKVGFKLFKENHEDIEIDTEETGRISIFVAKNDSTYKLDKEKFYNFIAPDIETAYRNRTLYGKKIGTILNHYPLDKEYFRLREKE